MSRLEELAMDMLDAQLALDRARDAYFEDCKFTGVPVFDDQPSLAYMILQVAVDLVDETRAAYNEYARQHRLEEVDPHG